MTSLPMTRRDADDFAALVDGAHTAASTRLAELMTTVDLLRSVETAAPRPEFLADLRGRLMFAADELLLPVVEVARPAPAPHSARSRFAARTRRRLVTVAAAAVLVGSTAGVAAAADSANPGDALYTLKRGIEKAELTLAPTDAARGTQLLHQADARLEEVSNLLESSDDVTQIESTLKDFRSSAGDGADLLFRSYQGGGNAIEIGEVHEFTSKQASTLDALSAQAPPTAADAFRSASGIVADIEQQARVLCIACGQGAPLAISDVLNPASATLDDLLVGPSRQAAAPTGIEALRKEAEAASKTAPTTPPEAGGTATAPAPSAASKGLPKVTETVGNEAVTKLLNSIGANNGPLSPVTTPLGKTIDDTLGGVTSSLNGLLNK